MRLSVGKEIQEGRLLQDNQQEIEVPRLYSQATVMLESPSTLLNRIAVAH